MRTKYTDEDIEFLRKYYPIGDWDSIFTRFPNLTKDQIYNVCHKRGISANYYDRDKLLKSEYYKNMVKTLMPFVNDIRLFYNDIGKDYGVPVNEIKLKEVGINHLK